MLTLCGFTNFLKVRQQQAFDEAGKQELLNKTQLNRTTPKPRINISAIRGEIIAVVGVAHDG